MTIDIILLTLAYLIGSIPTGLILSRVFASIDPRQEGSGNIGATNVLRTVGKRMGALTLVGDTLKGLIPVSMSLWLGREESWVAAIALGAFIGHLFPIWLRFRGGKGVATTLGVFLPLTPVAILCDIGVFAGGVFISKTISVGSLSAAVALPFLIWLFGYQKSYLILGIVVGILIFYRHRENIQRLLGGKESRL